MAFSKPDTFYRISVSITEDQYRLLVEQSDKHDVSFAQVFRDALDRLGES